MIYVELSLTLLILFCATYMLLSPFIELFMFYVFSVPKFSHDSFYKIISLLTLNFPPSVYLYQVQNRIRLYLGLFCLCYETLGPWDSQWNAEYFLFSLHSQQSAHPGPLWAPDPGLISCLDLCYMDLPPTAPCGSQIGSCQIHLSVIPLLLPYAST